MRRGNTTARKDIGGHAPADHRVNTSRGRPKDDDDSGGER